MPGLKLPPGLAPGGRMIFFSAANGTVEQSKKMATVVMIDFDVRLRRVALVSFMLCHALVCSALVVCLTLFQTAFSPALLKRAMIFSIVSRDGVGASRIWYSIPSFSHLNLPI